MQKTKNIKLHFCRLTHLVEVRCSVITLQTAVNTTYFFLVLHCKVKQVLLVWGYRWTCRDFSNRKLRICFFFSKYYIWVLTLVTFLRIWWPVSQTVGCPHWPVYLWHPDTHLCYCEVWWAKTSYRVFWQHHCMLGVEYRCQNPAVPWTHWCRFVFCDDIAKSVSLQYEWIESY